jgi:hypothetical protein
MLYCLKKSCMTMTNGSLATNNTLYATLVYIYIFFNEI